MNESENKQMGFLLDNRLAQDALSVTDLPLCNVRLMNCRDFPWMVLVPRVEDVSEWIELDTTDQHRLSDEIAIMSHIMKALFTAEKMNIASLGNQVSQLHVHVIARYKHDVAWPNPVWGHDYAPYNEGESEKLIYELKTALNSLQLT